MTYFTQFRKRDYALSENVRKKVTELSQYTDIVSRAADDASFYTFYNARPDERYDTISNQLYGTPDFYWTIPILNDRITNTWRDSTKSVPALRKFLESKYPGDALIIDPVDSLVGKFIPGEIVAYDINHVYRILGKYPSLRYLHVEPVSMDEFDVLEDPEEVWVLLTGLWNEVNDNLWDDTEIWRDGTNYVIGKDTLDSIKVETVIPAYKAPAFFTDPDGNRVPWYEENAIPTTIEEVETDINDENSRLKVIRPEFIRQVADQFELEMREAAELQNTRDSAEQLTRGTSTFSGSSVSSTSNTSTSTIGYR
jgi:hypothetical protein